ncbi:phosphoenolpyruvate--protein phosphotransferase [Burkholderia sp. WAC0059]|uniref:phosphoenolpyruvate--protein phosphotransferase n=1 Tax=Burkholderia sp. WAC0059 TaxID=2066022 RepID=UPI000C7F201A|nr:phosphoenolpyruvate--protein phosphotransferase [Burkholderia sp. WAC0059]PLZ03431.1 phosphoenolpyruvate--protein phosphotransferase [Burkholderia sp. WAC0059]
MKAVKDHVLLVAPLSGLLVPLAEVPDPVFAQGMFGDGVGIDPVAGRLVAPCDGTVMHLAPTGHAVTLQTPEGAEVLLHIGIDTAGLDGRGFAARVAPGERVRRGDLLIEFERDFVASTVPSLVSVVAIANSDAFEVVSRVQAGAVCAGTSPLLELRARNAAAVEAARGASRVVDEARATVTLTRTGGLHARPAARARESARRFDARVEVRHRGRKVVIDSVVGLLGLGVAEGASVELVGMGPQAREAIDAVAEALGREVDGQSPGERPGHGRRLPVQQAAARGGAPHGTGSLAGVGAAPGIAVGTLVHWDDAAHAPPEIASAAPEAERRQLDQALADVDAELARAVQEASQRGAAGEADIFSVHRMLLDDPALLEVAHDLVRVGKRAGFAWHEAIHAQISVLGNLADPLLAGRVADLRDVEKRVLRTLGHAGKPGHALPDEAVLAADEFTPLDLASLDRRRVTALVMARGGATSHAAIIARQTGIPVLVAVGDTLHALADGTQVVVDADAGRLVHAPGTHDVARARAARRRLIARQEANRLKSRQRATTRDGRAIEVAANIATLDDARVAVDGGADAVGLLRTELLLARRPEAPDVEAHRLDYQAIVDALDGRTAIIRTLDVGADKAVDYLTLPPEPNPALGLRGIRLAQARPELLDDQLRGLLAVRPAGAVRILLPMVTDAGEFARLRERIDALAREQGRTGPIEVGAMIEVPSAALLADQLARYADFLSIGTNDLTQYALAMDRCQPALADRADGLHPAVLRLVAATVQGARQHGTWVGVCGALAGDPQAVPLLVGLGVTELSVDPVAVPTVKARVRGLDYALCRRRAQEALALESAEAVRAASRESWPPDDA